MGFVMNSLTCVYAFLKTVSLAFISLKGPWPGNDRPRHISVNKGWRLLTDGERWVLGQRWRLGLRLSSHHPLRCPQVLSAGAAGAPNDL